VFNVAGIIHSRVANMPGAVSRNWDWKPSLDHTGELMQISSFGADHDGELYIVELTGTILKLVPAS
jgi:hypothetical protein